MLRWQARLILMKEKGRILRVSAGAGHTASTAWLDLGKLPNSTWNLFVLAGTLHLVGS
jgi:hypothetical protein